MSRMPTTTRSMLCCCPLLFAALPAPAPAQDGSAAAAATDTSGGLKLRTPEAVDGVTLIAPLNSHDVHLVDMDGKVVHTWKTGLRPAGGMYLLADGHLLHTGHVEGVPRFNGGGIGGSIQEFDWDGNLVWDYRLASDRAIAHHDISLLPNGNVLVIAWEAHPPGEAVAHGRDASEVGDEGFWPDMLVEVRPVKPEGGEIVWTWRTWDHLVQDRDPARPNFGEPSEHPGRIDINADHRFDSKAEETEDERLAREKLAEQMAAVGYVGGAPPPPGAAGGGPGPSGDWLHTNAVDYLPGEDLIVMSSPRLCEIYVIDHSTTTAEAATSSGGRRGHGGDLLWRWGNPRNYGMGEAEDRRLFYQHDPAWLQGPAVGAPAGEHGPDLRLTVFNNGGGRPGGDHSSVDELVLPFKPERGFVVDEGWAFGPDQPAWTYADPGTFFSPFISGAQRLPGGHTLICQGADGRVFEITPDGRNVWEYVSPLGGEVETSPQGGNSPPHALFRATRIARDDPRLAGKL